ncbi:MAG: acyltransferase family protein [Candidatus Bathyarchaeota archaeon]|nr:acyltransferase family protein [Candidatus Bathyarchaeota archaeon]
MTKREKAKPRNRLFYLDNFRIYLIILVILHHAAMAYSGTGLWYVSDPSVDAISSFFLLIFNFINQSYFMSAFFLLAGYFTPRSLERKGSKQFLKDRVIRLVIPIVIYTTIIQAINDYMIENFVNDANLSIWAIMKWRIEHLATSYSPAHLWFLQALLAFAVIYVIYRVLADRSSRKPIQLYQDKFPPNTILLFCIGVLTVLTFAVRLVFPFGAWFLIGEPAHFIHYIFCFFVGVLAYRSDWFSRLSRSQARPWGIMSLVIIPLIVVIIFGGGLENTYKFVGGLHYQAFIYAAWESFLMIGIIVFLLYFFRERLNKTGLVAKSMAANVYTVYIIHVTIIIALQILMLSINIPTIMKFFIVSLIAVPLCFTLSILIRRIPYARRVLG